MPRKLSGRSCGVDSSAPVRGPTSAYTCPSPGATARIIPLFPLDAPEVACRRLRCTVTEGPATTSNPYLRVGDCQPRQHPSGQNSSLHMPARPDRGLSRPGAAGRRNDQEEALDENGRRIRTRHHLDRDPRMTHGPLTPRYIARYITSEYQVRSGPRLTRISLFPHRPPDTL